MEQLAFIDDPTPDLVRLCSCCGDPKPAGDFYSKSTRCRGCKVNHNREWRNANRAEHQARAKAYKARKRRESGSQPIELITQRANRKRWQRKARAIELAASRARRPNETPAESYRRRYRTIPAFAAKERMRRQTTKARKRCGIGEVMRGGIRRNGSSPTVERLLGYTIAELVRHMERQFTAGMDWAAFQRGEIHIDHIVPQAAFNLSDDNEWRACWALSNLRPCWAGDNLRKSAARVFLL